MAQRLQAATALAAALLLLSACADDGDDGGGSKPDVSPSSGASIDPDAASLDVAVSEPREDSYYPENGDPGVDALHYDLALAWDPEATKLTAVEQLTFRATETADEFQLDFGEPLEISELTVDGDSADYEKDGKDLVVSHAVEADQRYQLEIHYSGTPEPVEAPVQRQDFDLTGWQITDDGETWTMQEPLGAFTWYAVNDQPSDKALYDFTLTVPTPWTGVANGELLDVSDDDGMRTTTWHLAEPASSYLVTTAFGDYDLTRDRSASGVPITYWTPRGDAKTLAKVKIVPEAMAWLEKILGPYPFDTFGALVVDATSAMETQTMITLGDIRYTLSPEVIVHEISHQWYGDQVTPDDWRDMWMNEGMAMYLQGMWEAEQAGIPITKKMAEWRRYDNPFREQAGPPGAYLDHSFGSSNVYYGMAVMYQDLREMVGDRTFFRMVRGWPRAKDNGNAGREEFIAYMEKSTGRELSAFFDAWLLGEKTPPKS